MKQLVRYFLWRLGSVLWVRIRLGRVKSRVKWSAIIIVESSKWIKTIGPIKQLKRIKSIKLRNLRSERAWLILVL